MWNSSTATTAFWNYCCLPQIRLLGVNTFIVFFYTFYHRYFERLMGIASLLFIKQCILGEISISQIRRNQT